MDLGEWLGRTPSSTHETVRLSEADGKAEGPRVVGREETGSLSCSQRNKRAIESGRAVCQGLLFWLPSEQPKKGAEQGLLASDVSPTAGDMQLE